jgi:hypothetical protein
MNEFLALFKQTIALISVVVMVSACGGRAANPVMVSQYGDNKKSCQALEMEMMNTQGEITRLIPDTEKTGKNVALGVAGAFLLVPWFFMDLSQAEQIEVNALRQRYNNLSVIATDKNCGFDAKPIPEFKAPANDKKESPDYPTGNRR